MSATGILAKVSAGGSAAVAAFRAMRHSGGWVMRLAADVFNGALLFACLKTTFWLYHYALDSYANSGGLVDPRAHGCGIAGHGQCVALLHALSQDGSARVYWLANAWAAAVFALGFAVVSAGGLRWAYWRVHDLLSR